MLKKTITYKDYLGVERTEDFHFNLTKAEALEMDMLEQGGMSAYVDRIVMAQDMAELITVFKKIILKSHGKISPDGRRFVKSEEISTEFSQTEAYSILFMELAKDADSASVFVNGIIDFVDEEAPKVEQLTV